MSVLPTQDILERVLQLPADGKLELSFASRGARELARSALYKAIQKTRRESKEAYAPTEPEWGITPWDDYMITREGETKLVIVPLEGLAPISITVKKVSSCP